MAKAIRRISSFFLSHLLLSLLALAKVDMLSLIDFAALREIKDSLTEIPAPNTTPFLSTWDFSAPDPCSSFAGVLCSSSDPPRVISLTLGTGLSDSPLLAGTISPSVSRLTELTQLVLFAGIVSGRVPYKLGLLKNLRVISLTNNRLTGSIPAAIFTLPNLHTLDLSHNQLVGFVPPTLNELTQLKVLVLAFNKLSGPLPELPTQLLHVDLKNNKFSGTLPKRMPSTLRYLSVSRNSLWGPLNGLDSLSELVYLDVSMNSFSGPIPTSLFRPSLSSLLLQRNNLSDTLPQLDILYSPDSIIDLSHNSLSGELPAMFSTAETIFLNFNRFSGVVPREYAESISNGVTKTLYLQHNYIRGFLTGPGLALPASAALCLSYNCMVPPVGLEGCPASAGVQLSRPDSQCSTFYKGIGGSFG